MALYFTNLTNNIVITDFSLYFIIFLCILDMKVFQICVKMPIRILQKCYSSKATFAMTLKTLENIETVKKFKFRRLKNHGYSAFEKFEAFLNWKTLLSLI